MKQFLFELASLVVYTVSVYVLTLAGMFAVIAATAAFDLDPTLAGWCADVLEAILQTDESILENARRFLQKEE